MKHQFKIIGNFRDPRPQYQLYTPDEFVYFVVFQCKNCDVIWRVERSWPWVGKKAFKPTWTNCPGRSLPSSS